MCGIGIDSRMPDHKVLEAGYLSRCLQYFDFAIFSLQFCKSPRCGQNEFSSWNAPGSCSEIWQGNHGSTAMAVRSETLLRYMLGTFHDINTDVLSREILFERKLTVVGSIRRNNADELFLVNDFSQ